MKLNEYVEERPPRSQQYYNRVYLGLIAGLVLVVFVLFPKRGMEFKRYLSFDQQKETSFMSKAAQGYPVGHRGRTRQKPRRDIPTSHLHKEKYHDAKIFYLD